MASSSLEEMSEELIRKFISEYIAEMAEIRTDSGKLESFVENRLLDSFDVMNLISTLEKKFNVKFSVNEIIDDQFKTISGLASIVFTKYQER